MAAPAWGGLIGISVTGFAVIGGGGPNFFDPANGMVPPGYLNSGGATTVTVAEPAIEFGFSNSNGTVAANFTDSQLIITDLYLSSDNESATFTFTDPKFAGVSLVSNTYPASPTYSEAGGVITLNFGAVAASNVTPGTTYTAVFNVASVPEPASFALILAGLSGVALIRSRRRMQ